MNNFPVLKENQYAVLIAQASTGIIMNKELFIHNINSADDMYNVFENIDGAYLFIEEKKRKSDDLEFVIYDFQQKVMKYEK